MTNEAQARVKINNLLGETGWRLDDSGGKPANVIPEAAAGELGANGGFIDYLLLDEHKFPICVLEAKRESLDPINGKEQARRYAKAKNCSFAILSNGIFHYFWHINRGEPQQITKLPSQQSLQDLRDYEPDKQELAGAEIPKNFLKNKNLHPYQMDAIRAVQRAAADGKERFLLEMATGTGKTTIAAALCKLFLQTGNARRILFLVDRIELEDQAVKSFRELFGSDYFVQRNKDGSPHASHIVVSTVQSLLSNNKYRADFSQTDFDLVISDEAHRSIGGKARGILEYFWGYKLGLTATPKDYLRGADGEKLQKNNPKEWEQRNLRDTYKIFHCTNGEPTFRYDITKGAEDGYLIQPYVLDARTKITTQLLSDEGYAVALDPEKHGEGETAIYNAKDFEKKFLNDNTNRAICEKIIERGLPDPLTGEFGKTLVFCVRQSHAERIVKILNECARNKWGNAESDFAVQVTSSIQDAQEYARQFAGNNLNGHSQRKKEKYPGYRTSKTRVCVTVGMMTTGYDCPDLLNVALARPVFSPSEFIQMKGRGTRKHIFHCQETGDKKEKESFMLFDFFANHKYFEKDFQYHEKLPLPTGPDDPLEQPEPPDEPVAPPVIDKTPDEVVTEMLIKIGAEGMKVDRIPTLHEQFEHIVQNSETIQAIHKEQSFAGVLEYIKAELPRRTVDKIRQSYETVHPTQRKISLEEMLMKALEIIGGFKSRKQRLDEEFQKFRDIEKPDIPLTENEKAALLKEFFENYLSDKGFRATMDSGEYGNIAEYASFSIADLGKISGFLEPTAEYIREYLQAELAEFDWDSAA